MATTKWCGEIKIAILWYSLTHSLTNSLTHSLTHLRLGIMLDIQPPLSDPTINIANLHYSEIINTQVILRLGNSLTHSLTHLLTYSLTLSLGLLKYLWTLYDILAIKKEQIVVYSPSPAVVSSVINAIMTLFHQRSGSLMKCTHLLTNLLLTHSLTHSLTY
jgi:hypothetical protein